MKKSVIVGIVVAVIVTIYMYFKDAKEDEVE